MEWLMATVKRASQILKLLSGTDALRKLRADNQLQDARGGPTGGYDGRAVAAVTSGAGSEHWTSLRGECVAEAGLRSLVIHVAVIMNFGPSSNT
jgi:hypothetical protein